MHDINGSYTGIDYIHDPVYSYMPENIHYHHNQPTYNTNEFITHDSNGWTDYVNTNQQPELVQITYEEDIKPFFIFIFKIAKKFFTFTFRSIKRIFKFFIRFMYRY